MSSAPPAKSLVCWSKLERFRANLSYSTSENGGEGGNAVSFGSSSSMVSWTVLLKTGTGRCVEE